MTQLFNQIASEEDKAYAKAYYDLKNAIDSYLKLSRDQRARLVNEVGIELYLRQNQDHNQFIGDKI